MPWKPAKGQDYVYSVYNKGHGEDHVAAKSWLEEIKPQRCPECGWVHRDWYPRPFDVVLNRPIRSTMHTASLTPPLIMDESFYQYLASSNSTAPLGRSYVEKDGIRKPTAQVTVYEVPGNMIRVRAEQLHTTTPCTLCGYSCSYPGEGRMWVRRRDLGTRAWFMDGFSLLMTRELAATIPWEQYPKLTRYPISIRDDV